MAGTILIAKVALRVGVQRWLPSFTDIRIARFSFAKWAGCHLGDTRLVREESAWTTGGEGFGILAWTLDVGRWT